MEAGYRGYFTSGADMCAQRGQRHGEMGLAAPGLAEEQDRSSFLDESQGGEVVDKLAVYRWLEGEVEALQGSPAREVGEAQPCCQPAVPRRRHLLANDAGGEFQVVPSLGSGLLDEGSEALGGTGKAQVAEVVLDGLVGRRLNLGAHRTLPQPQPSPSS